MQKALSQINRNRRNALLYLVLVTVGMVLMAQTLGQMEFQTGLPVPGAEPEATTNLPVIQQDTISSGADNRTELLTIFALATVGFLAAVIVSVARRVNPKRVGQLALGLSVSILLLLLLDWTSPASPVTDISPVQSADAIPAKVIEQAPIGVPPGELNTIVTIILGVGVAILLAWLISKSRPKSGPQDRLSLEADAAIQAIESGEDLKNVILRCYGQMMDYVKEARGIDRPESVTPREFELILAGKGIPKESIRRLTRLFERARYGIHPPDRRDELDATECLTQIRDQGTVLEEEIR